MLRLSSTFRATFWTLVLACLVACLVVTGASADESDAPQHGSDSSADEVDFDAQVKPILVERCFRCHSQLEQESDLRLDGREAMLTGGFRGAAVVPGNSDDSLLIQAILGTEDLQMPPEGERVTDAELAVLRRWIDQGAKFGEGPLQHWAFSKVERPEVPEVKRQDWVRNAIDAFVAARHEQQGLQPVGEADKATLLRRVYLDLIGLPPTAEQVREFLADESPGAYDRVVERLLESPQYGERWGRHWMDVWRYSDWSGYRKEVRNSQPHIWRWREWIVQSLNGDKGYDRMIREMLAADEIAPGDADALRATGFLVRNWYKFNRNVWLENTVDHTTKAFLGLTVGCARCHDHMYDPITQQDYYRFRAFFEPHDVRTDLLPGEPDTEQVGLVRAYDSKLETPTYLFVRGDERQPDKDQVFEPGIPAVFGAAAEIQPIALPPQAYYPALKSHVQKQLLDDAASEVRQARTALEKARDAAQQAQTQLAALHDAQKNAKTAETPAGGKPAVVLEDDFAQSRPDVWQIVSGDFHYADGRLLQRQTGAAQYALVSRADLPRDFEVTFRFKITGGERWKSVGLSFDYEAEKDCEAVYLSAYSSGPKLQIAHHENGGSSYPPQGRRPYEARLNQEYQLRLAVRDQLMNVWLNDEFQLAYQLPGLRRPGRLAVWAFDATAEFLEVRATQLDPARALQPADADEPPKKLTLAQAEAAAEQAAAAVVTAEQARVAAEAKQQMTQAKIAADRARYATPPGEDAERLAQAAAGAERQWMLQVKQLELLEAEQALLKARHEQAAVEEADAEQRKKLQQAVDESTKKRDAARKAKEEAEAALAVETAEYAPLGEVYPATSSGRRRALAEWIASPDNPLTARVAVNHIWLRHFGEPLVESVFDFGISGRKPRFPLLLDWLAAEFVERDWSMKELHRLMVTSSTYRMSSSAAPDYAARSIDPDNHLLWRMNPRRMEAEVIRDSVLHVGGNLDLTQGGPEMDHEAGQTTKRRSLYYRHAYEKQMTFLSLFDAASVEECYRRSESVIPQQALALANSPIALAQSRVIARELNEQVGEQPAQDAAFVEAVFLRVLNRKADDAERQACLQFLQTQSEKLAAADSLTPFDSGPEVTVPPSEEPRLRARENLVHVLLNHNDFVTVR